MRPHPWVRCVLLPVVAHDGAAQEVAVGELVVGGGVHRGVGHRAEQHLVPEGRATAPPCQEGERGGVLGARAGADDGHPAPVQPAFRAVPGDPPGHGVRPLDGARIADVLRRVVLRDDHGGVRSEDEVREQLPVRVRIGQHPAQSVQVEHHRQGLVTAGGAQDAHADAVATAARQGQPLLLDVRLGTAVTGPQGRHPRLGAHRVRIRGRGQCVRLDEGACQPLQDRRGPRGGNVVLQRELLRGGPAVLRTGPSEGVPAPPPRPGRQACGAGGGATDTATQPRARRTGCERHRATDTCRCVHSFGPVTRAPAPARQETAGVPCGQGHEPCAVRHRRVRHPARGTGHPRLGSAPDVLVGHLRTR